VDHLSGLSAADKSSIKQTLQRLWDARVAADYHPEELVFSDAARESLRNRLTIVLRIASGTIPSVNRDEVIEAVERRLTDTGPSYNFELLRAGVRYEEGWWYFPVAATHARSNQPLPRQFVLTTFANIEEAMHSQEGENVLFIPFIPSPAEPVAA